MEYARWQGPDPPVSNGAVVMRLELETDEDAPRIARKALRSLCPGVDDDVLERTALLTSEVVTNAVHFSGGSEVRLDIWQSGATITVVASDDGPGFDAVALPGTIAGAESPDGGFGLPLLDTLSEAWGSGTGGDSWVWFEVSPRSIPSSVARAATEADSGAVVRISADASAQR